MTSTTRKRVLIGAGGVVGLLIVVLLALPSLIDLNGRKAEIATMVKKVTGRELVLDGPIALSILPTPTVTLSGVKFFNVPGSKNPNMVEVKTVTVKPSLGALLTGSIEVSEVTLVEPKIVLEINAEGKPNWEFAPSVAEAKPAAPKPDSPRPLSLGRLTIDNGTLIFSDSKAGLSIVAEKANFSASVRSLDGPYSIAGSATINGAPLKLDLSVGAKAADGHAVDLALEAGGKLGFKGKLSELGPNARLTGLASSSSDNLIGFADTLIKMTGQPQPDLPPLLAGKFTFDGAVDASQTSISIKDFKLALGQDNAGESLTLTLKPALAIEGKLAADRLDLDHWLAAMAKPATTAAPTTPPPAGATAAPVPPAGPSMLAAITAKLSFEIGELVYNKQPVRNIALELDARRGVVAVPKLTATLPGDLALQARSTMSGDPNRPTVAGDFSLVGPKLRETLAWLAVDVSSVPPDKLQRISLKGRMSSDGGNVQVSDAVFELDDLKGSGGITVTFSVPLSVVMQVNLDTLDLDSYLAAAPSDKKPAASAPAPTTAAARAVGPSIGLKAKIAKLIWNKETIGGIDVDIALRGDTIRLNDAKVSNLAGARLAVRGTVANYNAAQPRPDIAFNFEAPDMDRVLKLVGATPAGLGAVTASGGVAGSLEQVALREFAVNAAGQSLRATGTLALPGAAQGAPKSAAYKGSLTLNGQTLDGSIEATLGTRPNITADLKANVLDLDKIGGSAAPAPSRGQPAAAKAIDTGPLRSIDGNFKLVAATLISSSLRIGNADLAATLKDGVLTISHFKGTLYGGSLNFSGVVNASQPALAVDLKGDATGIGLGEMLRSTRGSNQFGSSIRVTIDGRLNATGIAVRAGGTTSDQLRSSLAGGANLGGHIFVGADEALRFIGGALAGAASGVIDNTLGNALGIVGQRGLSPTALLNAIQLVLNRFVNHDSPISGHIDIAGGVLTDRGLAVQGNRATANISTRTNLTASSTDTTINFMIAEDPTAPYIITTARGALSSPSLNVTRGTARDPAGMTSTLPGVGNIPGIGNLIPGQGGGQSGGQQRSPIPNIPLPIPNIFGR
ncbi:AsmA family protein [Reyranella soli]|uniref:Cell envelope biogenesis protein AsmA n=1 Tax=Reyranella soli TaxID=1230389 RepID=A0A512NDT5_9HYPH|nr:AsmA family protein [Reyranella soli]GEP57117.1 cell envelope biogenesis protein AsmA [Reyranella soli]